MPLDRLQQSFITCLMVPPFPQSSAVVLRPGVEADGCFRAQVCHVEGEPLGTTAMAWNRARRSCSASG